MKIGKKLQSAHLFFLCMGCIIGWGAFILPGELFLKIGLLNAVLGMILGALLITIIAHSYIFVLSHIPKTGGEFIFTRLILGKKHGLICGWFLALAYLCIIPLNATALPIVLGYFGFDFLHSFLLYHIQDSPVYLGDVLVSVLSIVSVFGINFLGNPTRFQFQKIITLILCLSILIVFIMVLHHPLSWQNIQTYSWRIRFDSILSVLALSPWLFVGFECGVQIVKDVHYQKRLFSIFTMLSIWGGLLLYLLILCTTAFGLSFEAMLRSKWATGESVAHYFGKTGEWLLLLGIFSAIFSGINGFFIATHKIFYAMAKDAMFARFFRLKNCHSSQRILLFIAFLSCLMPFFGRQALLFVVKMSSAGLAIAFFYVCWIAFLIQQKKYKQLDFLAILGVFISLFFLFVLFFPASPSALKWPSLLALFVWTAILGVMIAGSYRSNGQPDFEKKNALSVEKD